MKSIAYLFFFGCTLFAATAFAQLGMGGQPHPSAALDVKATDKAFYPPRLTTPQRKAIVNPQPGAFVYDLDQSTMYLFDGQSWLPMAFQDPANTRLIGRTANDGAALDYFGKAVAISGDYVIVGAFGDDINTNANQGSAYIFTRVGGSWVQQTKLIASDGAASDQFGTSVAISGDYAVVGTPNKLVAGSSGQGAVYVFMRSGSVWTQQTKLIALDGTAGDKFGSSVAIAGDYALVGSPGDDIGISNGQGSAYVFTLFGATWSQQAKLTANDGATGDGFGGSVAISGDYALIGAPDADIETIANQGAAYIFTRTRTTWTQQTKFRTYTYFNGGSEDHFGNSVAISGDYAVVGAYHQLNQKGGAYIYIRSGAAWALQTEILSPEADSEFGTGVAVSGDYVIVGAPFAAGGVNNGKAYVYKRSGIAWQLLRTLNDTVVLGNSDGISVGIANGSFIIGGYGFQNFQGRVSFGTMDN